MEERKVKFYVLIFILILFIAVCTPFGVKFFNDWQFELKKADDATNYETIKKVEESCRAMIASYESDKLTYEQYRDSESAEKQSWAEQAKMRANKTASTYNNYILENSFIWEDNIPKDVRNDLDYLE